MKFLKRVWNDFQHGENIDLYITMIGAIVLVVLNILNIVPFSWIIPLNLSVLALISVAILGNRYRIDTVLEKISVRIDTVQESIYRIDTILEKISVGNEVLLTEFPVDISSEMSKAGELIITGVDLYSTMMFNYALFKEKLKEGSSIKILMVNPDSSACEIAALLHLDPITLDDERNTIYRTLKLCGKLKQEAEGNLEVRLTKHLPGFGSIAIDPHSPNGMLYLKYYSFKSREGPRPKMVFSTKDGYWYEFFRNEAEQIWNNAEIWNGSMT